MPASVWVPYPGQDDPGPLPSQSPRLPKAAPLVCATLAGSFPWLPPVSGLPLRRYRHAAVRDRHRQPQRLSWAGRPPALRSSFSSIARHVGSVMAFSLSPWSMKPWTGVAPFFHSGFLVQRRTQAWIGVWMASDYSPLVSKQSLGGHPQGRLSPCATTSADLGDQYNIIPTILSRPEPWMRARVRAHTMALATKWVKAGWTIVQCTNIILLYRLG